MSENNIDIIQLIKRVEALEEKSGVELNNARQKNENNNKNKLSLKRKKRTTRYLENDKSKPVPASSTKQKKGFFASIQFSSEEDEQNKEVQDPQDQPSIGHPLNASGGSHGVFVPDSCPNQNVQSPCGSSSGSRNISDLVCDAEISTVGDSFHSQISTRQSEYSLCSFQQLSAAIPETSSSTVSFGAGAQSVSVNCHQMDGHSSNQSLASSHSLSTNVDNSVLHLTQRLSQILSKKVKKSKKGYSSSGESQSSLSNYSEVKYGNSFATSGRDRKNTGERMKLVNAVCFSSDDDDNEANSGDDNSEAKSLDCSSHKDENHCNNSASPKTVSNNANVGAVSSQPELPPEEIISLTDRLDKILLVPTSKKKGRATKLNKPQMTKLKNIALPSLFSSDSDDMNISDEERVDHGGVLQKSKGNSSELYDPAQEQDNGTSMSDMEVVHKQDVSLQVSLPSEDEQYSEDGEMTSRQMLNDTDTALLQLCNKSLQCSFTSEGSANQTWDASFQASVTSKSLQVSINTEGSESYSSDALSAISREPDSVNSPCSDAGENLPSDETQPAMCSVSLQVSLASSDSHEDGSCDRVEDDEKDNAPGSEEISIDGNDMLYKTVAEEDTSDHLYKTVSEYDPSPMQRLFVDEGNQQVVGRLLPQALTNKLVKDNQIPDCQQSITTSLPKKGKHRVVYALSSSEADPNLLSDSGSESDADLPGGAQRTFGRRSYASPSISANNSIGPDQKYEDDSDNNIISQSHYESGSSSSEDELDTFLKKMKKPPEPKKATCLSDFIVADDELSSEEEESVLFHIRTTQVLFPQSPTQLLLQRKHKSKTKSSAIRKIQNTTSGSSDVTDSDLNEKENSVSTPDIPIEKPTSHTCRVPLKRPVLSYLDNLATPMKHTDRPTEYRQKRKCFLSSLSADCDDSQRDLESIKYVKNFKKHREELTCKLFKLYNETVFSSKLPSDLTINWNTRMYKTAGYCTYKKNKFGVRTAKVELSIKVCDSAERVRDTLIHELCHAVVWLLHGKLDGHGPLWKHWAYKANLIHPELPVISRCHSYKIHTKYIYRCTNCGYQIGRHSKSLDTASKVCGYCMSSFELISNTKNGPRTPRTPNHFALFVKENYSTVKKQGRVTHQEVMKKLAADFALKNNLND